ncbi:MAG: RNA pyrophosphohydrolase [Pseudomonadales bacterium]|nr:RNA pyrophosphohydrolase [Pseudomonadales bacterium]
MTDCIDADGYRANVGIVLMRPDGRVFLGRRVGGRGWQFPQGGVLLHEAPEEALFRELKEEIGLDRSAVKLVGATRDWLRYDLPKRYRRRGPDSFCIGQKQRWFLLRCTQAELPIRFDDTGEPEFDQFRWTTWWEPVREVIFFKRPVYVQALHELAPLAHPAGPPPYPEWWEQRSSALPA